MLTALIKSVLFALFVAVPVAIVYVVAGVVLGEPLVLPINTKAHEFSSVLWPALWAVPYIAVFGFLARLFSHLSRVRHHSLPSLNSISELVCGVGVFGCVVTAIAGPMFGIGVFVGFMVLFLAITFLIWATRTIWLGILWASTEGTWVETVTAAKARAEARKKRAADRASDLREEVARQAIRANSLQRDAQTVLSGGRPTCY